MSYFVPLLFDLSQDRSRVTGGKNAEVRVRVRIHAAQPRLKQSAPAGIGRHPLRQSGAAEELEARVKGRARSGPSGASARTLRGAAVSADQQAAAPRS
jgi:hypothetical protein